MSRYMQTASLWGAAAGMGVVFFARPYDFILEKIKKAQEQD
jgi:hypothetical protein